MFSSVTRVFYKLLQKEEKNYWNALLIYDIKIIYTGTHGLNHK